MTFTTSTTTGVGYTPAFRIRTGDDTDITGNFEDRLISLTVASYAGGGQGDRLDLILDDRDFQLASPQTDANPTTLTISLGYREAGLWEMGTFKIGDTIYSGMPRTMQISGSSFGFDNNAKAPVVTSYDGKTLGDIIAEIAASAGVAPSVDADLGAVAIPFLHQHASSLHLLQELERRYNGLAKFADGMLSFTKRGTGEAASGALLTGFVLEPEDLASWSIREVDRPAYSHVRAGWFDQDNVQHRWLTSATTGPASAQVPYMLKRAFSTQAEAQAAADSKMAELNSGRHFGSMTLAKGDPSIRGGDPFIIQNMRDGVNGSYVITLATHTLTSDQGIMTSLEFDDTGADFSTSAGSEADAT